MKSYMKLGGVCVKGLKRVTAPVLTVAIVCTLAGCPPEDPSTSGIDGTWGGYWSYAGTDGDVYIEWDFDNGTYSWFIEGGATCSGTFTTGVIDGHQTIDVTIEATNTDAWVIGNTYCGWFKIEDGALHFSQMFDERLDWSDTVLDPEEAWVWVGWPVED